MTIETKTRTFRVEIETPAEDSGKRVTFHRVTEILQDGEVIGRSKDQPNPITYTFLDEAATMRTATDPVTGKEVTISIACIAALIRADYDARNVTTEE